jgi:hypothetical protein
MPFRIDRFRLSYKTVVGKDPSSGLGIRLSEYKIMKTPARKASFIKKLMDRLLAKNSRRVATKVMLEGKTMGSNLDNGQKPWESPCIG